MAERRQDFERDLEAIEAKIIELFAMVAEDLPEATKALLTGNSEIMQRLIDRDKDINALYPETEELANREILLQAPVADDLRFLLSVLRVLTEFELSHDLIIQIATRGNHFLGDDLSPRPVESWSGWGPSRPTCGVRPRTAGTSGTGPRPSRWPSVTTRWTSSTPA